MEKISYYAIRFIVEVLSVLFSAIVALAMLPVFFVEAFIKMYKFRKPRCRNLFQHSSPPA